MIKHIYLLTVFTLLWPPSNMPAMGGKYTYDQARNYLYMLTYLHRMKNPWYTKKTYRIIRKTILFDLLKKKNRIDYVNSKKRVFSLDEIDGLWLTELLSLEYKEQNMFYIELED